MQLLFAFCQGPRGTGKLVQAAVDHASKIGNAPDVDQDAAFIMLCNARCRVIGASSNNDTEGHSRKATKAGSAAPTRLNSHPPLQQLAFKRVSPSTQRIPKGQVYQPRAQHSPGKHSQKHQANPKDAPIQRLLQWHT
ncbi:hypothetical protein WJX79_010807 [Trebouxia sp. C0005]